MLAHVASTEGETAVENCFGKEKAMPYHCMPGAIFTSPEIHLKLPMWASQKNRPVNNMTMSVVIHCYSEQVARHRSFEK